MSKYLWRNLIVAFNNNTKEFKNYICENHKTDDELYKILKWNNEMVINIIKLDEFEGRD